MNHIMAISKERDARDGHVVVGYLKVIPGVSFLGVGSSSIARWLMFTSAFSILASCSGQSIDVKEMAEALSAELSAVSEEVLAPVDLSGGYRLAVANAVRSNAGYQASLASEREAMSYIGVAKSVLKPQLSANASLGSVLDFDGDGASNSGLMGGVTLSQLVFDGGESIEAINRATAEALGAQAQRRVKANELALEVARAWIDVWQYSERLGLLKVRTGEMDTLVGQIERMAHNGMLDQAALDSARRKVVEIQLEESRLQSDLADAHVRFQRYFRQSARDVSPPIVLMSAVAVRSQARNWRGAPSLEARAAALVAARHAVAEAQAAFGPRVLLQAGMRSPLESAGLVSGSFGFGFDYSPLDGGRRVHRLEAAVARAEALDRQLREEQTALKAELESSLTKLEGIDRSMPLLLRKLNLSKSEAEIARSQILTGQSNLRQLVEAEIETYRSEDQQIAMQAELQILLLNIGALTGALAQLVVVED